MIACEDSTPAQHHVRIIPLSHWSLWTRFISAEGMERNIHASRRRRDTCLRLRGRQCWTELV